jgi:hypothetical protein
MSDEPVFHHVNKLRALAAQRSMLVTEQAEREKNGGCLREVDTAFAEHSGKWHPAMRDLADAPAGSVEAIAAKLRILAASMISGQCADYNEDILLLAISDLDRLSAA